MMKVMTIVGTRPEIIKMCRVIAEFEAYVNHVLVHTGQNYDYELNQVFFDNLGIRKPDHFLNAAGANAAKTIAEVIAKVDDVLELERPDAVLLYGDTNSCLAVIPAKRRQIPVFHMEAGNRCFDQRVPEELNRKVLDHLSDINFVLTEHGRRYLIAEGIRPETIIKSGSHMREVLDHFASEIDASDVLAREGVEAGKYFIASVHREENVDDPRNLEQLMQGLSAAAAEFDMPVIVSTHPRTQKRIADLPNAGVDARVRYQAPMGFFDYVKLQKSAFCVLSDSGTISEEASLLNLPAITLRNAHERPEGMDVGTLIMTGLKRDDILASIRVVTSQHDAERRQFEIVADYNVPNVSRKILRVVMSYTGYVNRTVWKKG
ncbi:non-hydrolyzing UDP-N-acetylglucosamine 2-epimerase [Pelagerythrobacter aerophilus]|uniref:UDP-N-acetylglucosamine 2-epimerase (Non-hydrolyzing) n=1 Tax=Pelagerythrobacter aerophilus TaxID=2306995 RepID=A0A418NLL6_9SPHN|nr:UDP-N-acetylglucosamine 2-epimerase (non-hydrolyzing) [Pelagerythrobacter aerophilus]RIV76039.1 UDP-N-acetylglucosamine 2-epimerase (non-hydrolyzing) [Pelagerythrobacter aerophilus]RIV80706.1 UDP-N-acetylglucosamine 2-epimerase (non-hydrolyzing) [Pelagerythrobacter aerophilus]